MDDKKLTVGQINFGPTNQGGGSEDFDPLGDTVLMELLPSDSKITQVVKKISYLTYISLENKKYFLDSQILNEIEMNCETKRPLVLGEKIYFDFTKVERWAQENGSKKTVKIFADLRKKYPKIISTKNYQIVQMDFRGIIFIRPLVPKTTSWVNFK